MYKFECALLNIICMLTPVRHGSSHASWPFGILLIQAAVASMPGQVWKGEFMHKLGQVHMQPGLAV